MRFVNWGPRTRAELTHKEERKLEITVNQLVFINYQKWAEL
jgi:hypothetical protein